MTEQLGPYEIRGELGRGAMAVVWRGFDTRLERECAIKEPTVAPGTDAAAGAELAARFVREGQAAAKLNHPGIVTVFTADVYDGRPAIVMELIEGETLGEILERGPLPEQAALSLVDQLLDAVGYAHTRGVVHRDIKPDNVFVTHDGRVKLTDFGIAHLGTDAALTHAGTVMGTPGYMAPEQVTGQPVDARADIFAIGTLLYECLTGQNPFGATEGAPPTTVMYRIVHEQVPEVPSGGLSNIASGLMRVVTYALAKDAGERFQTAEEFRTALTGDGIGPASVPPVMPVPAERSSSSLLIYGLIGAGVLVVAFLAVSAMSGGPASSAVTLPAGEAIVVVPTAVDEDVAVEKPVEPEPEEEPFDATATQAEVEAFVWQWKESWESQQLDRYMSFYAKDFQSNYKRMDHDQWRTWKREVFGRYGYQIVTIEGMTVDVRPGLATVEFLQTFQSDGGYSDYGRKTLNLRDDGSGWKIVGEEWIEY